MNRLVAAIVLCGFCILQGTSVFGVDGIYNLSEMFIPKSYEMEEKRKVCAFPFREDSGSTGKKEFESRDYLSRGIPALLVTEIRKMGFAYDENIQPTVIRHAMGPHPSKKSTVSNGSKDKVSTAKDPKDTSQVRTLEGGGLKQSARKKLNLSETEWEDILSGKTPILPSIDPRYIPLDVSFLRDEKNPPEPEHAFRLGTTHKCFYVITGEYRKTGDDSLFAQYELTSLWDGKIQKGSHQTSFIRAFQEMQPLADQIRRHLISKDLTSLSVETGTHRGALVFLDNVYIGKTPLQNYPIIVGKHEILVTEKDHEDIYEEFTAKKAIPIQKNFTMRPYPKTAFLSVESDPPGAEVYLGIQKIGETPLKKVAVPPGKNRLRVSKEEHIDYFTGVDMKPGVELREKVTLRMGETEIYYTNKDYVFLDYTYKDFATYTLFSSLLFYAGHIYYQMQASRLQDSIRPEIRYITLNEYLEHQAVDPTAATSYLLYEEYLIQGVQKRVSRYRRLSGDLGIDRNGGKFEGGTMLYGAGIMLIASFTLFFMGLDRETFDIGFDPGSRGGGSPHFGIFPEARGHFQYNFRF